MILNTITFSAEFKDEIGLSVDFEIDGRISTSFFQNDYKFCVNPNVLVSSFFRGVGDYLFTCAGCGVPGCSGIYCECAILHHDKMIFWVIPNPVDKSHSKKRSANFGFDYV